MSPPANRVGGEATVANVTSAVIFYCLCSGGMLIVNKLTMHHIPLPALATVCQFSTASVVVYGGRLLGQLEMDGFEWQKARHYLVYVMFFTIGTWTNMKVLSIANVETVIVARSCTPCAVCVLDYVFYGRALPNLRSLLSLLLIIGGAVCYILTDREFQANGWAAYYWVLIWWAVLVVQLTYGKFLVTGIKLLSLWTPVLYTNTFSVIPALTVAILSGELSESRLSRIELTPTGSVAHGVARLPAHLNPATTHCPPPSPGRAAPLARRRPRSPSASRARQPRRSLACAQADVAAGVVLCRAVHQLGGFLVPVAHHGDGVLGRRRDEQDADGLRQRPHLGQARVGAGNRLACHLHRRRLSLPAGPAARAGGRTRGRRTQGRRVEPLRLERRLERRSRGTGGRAEKRTRRPREDLSPDFSRAPKSA